MSPENFDLDPEVKQARDAVYRQLAEISLRRYNSYPEGSFRSTYSAGVSGSIQQPQTANTTTAKGSIVDTDAWQGCQFKPGAILP
jgi:hypothetical protein